jgi:hypothetical protein
MQRFNSAVRTIALYRAKKAVQAQIRARVRGFPTTPAAT